jgi:hypothetical protein
MNRSVSLKLTPMLHKAAVRRGLIFGGIILCALLAFEVFNFSSTLFALNDVLGDLAFGPIKWATLLAFAFCSIDFAGIARIFTPEQGNNEPAEVWYLFGAWFLAAAFNATLTWWGVSVAMMNQNPQGGVLLGPETMTKIVPIVVALMVLAIRVLLINTFSVAGDRIFSMASEGRSTYQNKPYYSSNNDSYRNTPSSYPKPAPKPVTASPSSNRSMYNEPTYHNIGTSASPKDNRSNTYMS